jgi:hypothetical protein
MYWGDATQLGTRYDLVNRDNLRGVGFWTLNYGGGSSQLWSALQNHFVKCASVAASASPVSAAMVGTAISVTATSSGCQHPDPLYEFWVKAPGASQYSRAQAYSTSAILNWNTARLAKGTYRFSVWVRDASSPGAFGNSSGRYDAFNASLLYTLTAGCPAFSGSASPPSPAGVGTPVNVTASAPGCPNPLFEFWVLAPGASVYSLARGYGTAVLSWNTSGLAPGTYRFSIWVRDNSSTGTFGNGSGRYDAYNASLLFTLT